MTRIMISCRIDRWQPVSILHDIMMRVSCKLEDLVEQSSLDFPLPTERWPINLPKYVLLALRSHLFNTTKSADPVTSIICSITFIALLLSGVGRRCSADILLRRGWFWSTLILCKLQHFSQQLLQVIAKSYSMQTMLKQIWKLPRSRGLTLE